MTYTLREIDLYLSAIKSLADERAHESLQIGFAAAQGKGESVEKMAKALRPKRRPRVFTNG